MSVYGALHLFRYALQQKVRARNWLTL